MKHVQGPSQIEVFRVLEKAGANLLLRDNFGKTALDWAMRST